MGRPTRSKINQLLSKWPQGTVAVQAELTKLHVSKQLTVKYQKGTWLKRIGRGAFMRADDSADWMGGVYAIQQQLKLPIHPGGKTALQLQGYAHFVPLGKNYPVWLLGAANCKLPLWFKTYSWGMAIQYSAAKLFLDGEKLGLVGHSIGSYSIEISSPERAILEVLNFVPGDQSFAEARLLMEGLTTLRPRLVQQLLECCNSVKVKRLFLYLADSCQHPWLKKINLSKVDLGHGKRMIVKGGHWDAKYKITVPSEPS